MMEEEHNHDSRCRFTTLELIGASCLRLGHDLANDVTTLSAMKSTLEKARTSSEISQLERVIKGLQRVSQSVTSIIQTINHLRSDFVMSQNKLSVDEFIQNHLKPSLRSGWCVELKQACHGNLHTNVPFLCASLNEIVSCLAPSGKVEVGLSQGRVDMLELGMPLHLATHQFLRLDFLPTNTEIRFRNDAKPVIEARLRGACEILRLLGCTCKDVSFETSTAIVLVPTKPETAL